MNSWKVCYPKRLDSSVNLYTAVIMCMDYKYINALVNKHGKISLNNEL